MATVTYNGYTLPDQHGKITYDATDNVTIRFSTSFSILASSYETVRDTLKLPDKDFTIFGETFAITGNATRIKTTFNKAGNSADGPRQYVSLTVEVTLKDDKAGDSGLRDFSSDLTKNEQGGKTITVTGRFTGTDGGSGAGANYSTNIAAIVATLQTFYGGGIYFPMREETADLDRFDNELRFQVITVESLETANEYTGGVENFEPDIMFSRWNHSSSRQLERGHNDEIIEFVTVSFECLYKRSFATPRTTLRARIAGLVIKRLITQFNCSGVVLQSAEESYSSTDESARATWTFRCDNGPQYSKFDELISDELFYGGVEKITDGKALTMASFSAGATMKLTQGVEAKYIGSSPGDPIAPGIGSIDGAVLIPESRTRIRGTTKFGTEDIGIGDQKGIEEERFTLSYTKVWWIVIPSKDDPDKTVVRPAQAG